MTIDEATIYDVVIVGGGITGLLTAYMLRDQNVLLLERTGRLGGKVKTITIGNIQLCGDYTHRVSYLAGAAYSSLRAARALGSKHVVPGDKEVVLPDPPRWGRFGFASLAAAVAGVVAAVIGFTA